MMNRNFVLLSLLFCLPAPAQVEIVTLCNVAITASDGAELRANVSYPDGGGRFPTVVEITGYNKGSADYGGNCSDVRPELVQRGYAALTMDDRGTGASEGEWDRYGPRTRLDYRELLDWIQAQDWSDGKVGATGTSYSAGTSFALAAEDGTRIAEGKPQAVYAVWGNVPMSDMYRDYPHVGGFVNQGFTVPWLALVAATSSPPPSTIGEDPDAPETWLGHFTNLQDMHVPLTAGAQSGGPRAYDDDEFYRQHSPGYRSERIRAAMAWTGGWFDIFQRGAVDWWSRLPNAAAKKMWMQPIYHVGGENVWGEQDWCGAGYCALDTVSQAELVNLWWDRWLKGEDNGADAVPNINLWRMGERSWYHGDDWPEPVYTPLYFAAGPTASASSLVDGALSPEPPAQAGGDSMMYTDLAGACTRSTAQWSGGFVGGLAETDCQTDNRNDEINAITYTTEALETDVEVTGMITADIWAASTAPDTALVVRLLDVAPDGTSTQVAAGHLIGRHRALDPEKTLYATRSDGERVVIRPFHPFDVEHEQLLTPGEPTNFKVEIYPTSNVFAAGHRIRIAVTTSDLPAMTVPTPWHLDMLGGELTILRSPEHPSHVLLPLVAARGSTSASRAAGEGAGVAGEVRGAGALSPLLLLLLAALGARGRQA